MNTKWIASALLLVSLVACKGEIEGGEAPEAPKAKKKSNVVKLTTAVPYGKHIACADALPSVEIFSEKIGDEIGEIKDKGKSNSGATMVCSMVKAGEPPESPKELKTLEEKYAKLGVLPGDEYCQVSAHCSVANDIDTFRRKCEQDGNQMSTLAGEFACLRATPKGPDYSYTYKFIEPDTKCVVEAMAGPSVSEQELVKNCALAAREGFTKNSVAKPF